MEKQIRDQVARLLNDLAATQTKLLVLFERKRVALRKARPAELLEIADLETALVEQLQEHVSQRERLLNETIVGDAPCESIADLLSRLAEPEDSALLTQLGLVRHNAELLRRESWVQWIVAQRAHRHYSDVLEIIAHRGGSSPTYSKHRNTGNNAGALLDTSI